MPGKARRNAGALEAEVLAIVGAADGPQTPQQVLDQMARSAAYTTVMTTLTRLAVKGVLVRTAIGRAYGYSLAVPDDEIDATLTARQMAQLLEGSDNRATALARFVAHLDPADEAVLNALLNEK